MSQVELVYQKGEGKGPQACLVVFVSQDKPAAPKGCPKPAQALLERAVKLKSFAGKKGQSRMLLVTEGPVERVLLVGLGKTSELDREALRRAAGAAGKLLADMKVAQAAVLLPQGLKSAKVGDVGTVLAEGLALGAYTFLPYKAQPPKDEPAVTLKKITLLDVASESSKQAVAQGTARAAAICRARDLGNHPANVATPEYLAQEAKQIGKARDLKVTVLDEAQMKKLGMDMLLGVARGSRQPPRLIIMEYRPKGAKGTLMFVGKGITFDSGGISIKPSQAMDEMKFDMCGAAAVISAMDLIPQMDIKVNIVAMAPACENLPGGLAQKPGDIVKAYNGKTVEILNTDAEGRLVLGDALAYGVEKFKPDAIVDLATLTGACVVALGHYATGAVSNHEAWQSQVVAAGRSAGDLVWPFPALAVYEEELKGKFSDLKNIGSRDAGTITGGLFLKSFVGETPWVHLDIAGTAWGVKNMGHIPNDGATGVGVALLADLAAAYKKP